MRSRLFVAVRLDTAAAPTPTRRDRGRGPPHDDVAAAVAEDGGMITTTILAGGVLVAAATVAIMTGIDPAVGAGAATHAATDDALR